MGVTLSAAAVGNSTKRMALEVSLAISVLGSEVTVYAVAVVRVMMVEVCFHL